MESKKNNGKALLAAVEGGGTSFRVVVFQVNPSAVTGSDALESNLEEPEVVARDEFDSSHDNSPQETLQQCAAFFQKHKPSNGKGYAALGIAIFGPVGVHENQPETYGTILSTSPKAIWRNVDFLTPIRQACQGSNGEPLPVLVETDVNAPALAEFMRAKSKQKKEKGNRKENEISSASYITVGTGVGVGLVINGKTVHGRMHPEGGHIPVQPLEGDTFKGYSWGQQCSPFGGKNTVEGIASSVALTERLLQRQQDGVRSGDAKNETSTANSARERSVLADIRDDDDELFDHAANALANLCATLLLMLSMEKIVLGGGLMKRKGLLDKITKRTVILLNGYLELPADMSSLITASEYGNDAGLNGAMVLAQQALKRHQLTQLEPSQDSVEERRMKQEAFGIGLWHGMIVGAVVTAALFQWLRVGPRRK
ncbi:hypothetical protein ACA910_009674 [Epithemia clementina (nom. ined.)]